MSLYHSCIFILLLCTFIRDSKGQSSHISFDRYTVEHGLSAPVTHITQDKFGFLWLGTTDGLNRFDGNNFIVYRHIPGDTNSIASNIINALYVDTQGRVWAATNGGLCYYDFEDDRFHSISFNDTLEVIDRYRVHAVHGAADDRIWFASRSFLHLWEKGKYTKSIRLPGKESLLIKDMFVDTVGRIWVGSNEGIHVYMPDKNKFLHRALNSPFSIANNLQVTVHPIHPFGRDTVLTGTWYADLQKVFISNDEIRSIPFTDTIETDPRRHIVSGLSLSDHGALWVGTYGNGLAWFDTRTNTFTQHFHHDPSNARSLSSDYINDIFTDVSGIVWIGSIAGLDKFDPLTQQFSSVTLPVPSDHFAVYRLVNTIAEDPGEKDLLWLCVSGVGLFEYRKDSRQFKLYQLNAALGGDQLIRNNIYAFYTDKSQRTWIGTRSGLFLFDTSSKQFSEAPSLVRNAIKGVHTILEDADGNFWFATHSHGIYKFNEKNNELTSFRHNINVPNSLQDDKVFSMLQDSRGMIWIGTQNRGLSRLDPSTGKFTFFSHEKFNPETIPDNGVYDLYEDKHGRLWMSTENGLAAMDLNSFQIKHFNTNHGLCNNTIFSITPDHQNKLWLGTNNGLSHFDPEEGSFRNYYMSDGLPGNRIDGEVYFTGDSILFFATTSMLSYCHPHEMKINRSVPPIVITDYAILGKKAPLMREGGMLLPIHLSYKQNMITFNFAALNFSNTFLNQYAYKLEGFDENWIYSGHNQSATYTNLNGGSYTFRVKGANNDGVWNESGSSVLLIVHPPFWRTWWFYILCTIGIAAILYFFYRIRINQLMKMQAIRSRIARDLHDDIGSTLSSINMLSSMADQTKIPQKKSSELFHTIAAASGQAMDLMGDIVWSINPENDKMERMITRMRQYASEILEAANIDFTLEIDDHRTDLILPLEIRKDFFLIFKEAVNNLAKYSGASHAKIKMNVKDHTLHLSIHDNGSGFDISKVYEGNGLKNMRTRAGHMNGHIEILSGKSLGTRIELAIPLIP